MTGQFFIDLITQFLECLTQIIELVSPEDADLTVRPTGLGFQGFSREARKDVLVVTTDHHHLID